MKKPEHVKKKKRGGEKKENFLFIFAVCQTLRQASLVCKRLISLIKFHLSKIILEINFHLFTQERIRSRGHKRVSGVSVILIVSAILIVSVILRVSPVQTF